MLLHIKLLLMMKNMYRMYTSLLKAPTFTYRLKLKQLIIILQVALTVIEVTLEIFYRIEIIGIM